MDWEECLWFWKLKVRFYKHTTPKLISPHLPLPSNMRYASHLLILLTMWKLKKFPAFRKKKKSTCLCPASSVCFELWSSLFFLPGQAISHHGCCSSVWVSLSTMSTTRAKLSCALCSFTLSAETEICVEECLPGQGLEQGALFLYSDLG